MPPLDKLELAASYTCHFTALTQCDLHHYGEIRLMNGIIPSEGRVEICGYRYEYYNEMRYRSYYWGTICRDEWDNSAAKVVCRERGHTPDGKCGLIMR